MTHRWSRASRHARGYGGEWDRLREQVLSVEPLCRECRARGRVTAATNVDHILAKSKGGGDELENLRPLCDDCRRVKDAADRGARLRPTIGVDGWPTDER